MFPSLKLGRIFDIPVQIHWTFWLLPLLVVLTQRGETPIALQLIFLFAIFACIVLHELGHALAARMYGIRTRSITLLPIGGVASLERISEKPTEELVIAAAGPAVNVLIALALGAGIVAANAIAPEILSGGLAAFIASLIFANLLLIGFNMIPAFPLDGGRMFRAVLAFFTSYVKATRIAVYVGTALTVILTVAVFVFSSDPNPFLLVIALFVFTAGRQELAMLEYRERMRQAASVGEPPSFTVSETPRWMQPPVTVYLWDPSTHQWVEQKQRV